MIVTTLSNLTGVKGDSISPAGEGIADVDADEPGWFTTARVRFVNGTRYDIVYSEFLTMVEKENLCQNFIPESAEFMGFRPSGTFADLCDDEYTASWWIAEDNVPLIG